ncbi:D-2-hydroxyacid dehydrogenase [Fontisphaera persica]|uniref:D-2-hydroxyacid dehydrogenase n=1 Tax=Fontisphaera persica TaxID=2974023 RepID=UPI0024BF275F|nr:D-2-hydroxyacid dehydrogenase [Fontisphaera persica]WCJ59834.1 D-2-hydroxyacid dehydrogenase [Fontisphaera persica]
MKIVVLDGFAANPGDLSWAGLEALGELQVFDRTPPPLILERAQNAEILFTNKTPLRAETLAALPRARYIGVLATGYDVVDVAAARRQGITVCNVPDYSTPAVTQAVFALLLELTNHVGAHARSVQAGDWCRSPDFSYWLYPLVELRGLTLGLVGFGRIARSVAQVALALGMRVLACRKNAARGSETFDQVQIVDLESLLCTSDVVSLHCPLTAETRGLLNAERLAWMKPSAYLINTARGALIVEADLAKALHEGRIAGAAVDVLSQEPPPPDHPLLQAPRCIITPHHAWATRAARERLLRVSVDNLRAFLNGQPQNVVN